MSRKQTPLVALFAASLLLVAPLALAQGGPPPGKGGGACQDDIAALCPNIQPGPGAHRAIAACLASQPDKVSPGCRSQIDAMKAKAQAAREACQPDVEKFCAGVPAGQGQVMQCLKQHASELSDACKAVQQKHRAPPPPPPAAPPAK